MKSALLPSVIAAALSFGAITFALPSESFAISYGNCSQFDMLDSAGATKDPRKIATALLNGALFRENFDTITPLEIANRESCILQSLVHGADANNKLGPSAPLVVAISNRDEPAVRALLKYKANPDTADSSLGQNPPIPVLKSACILPTDAIAVDLIQAGANPSKGEPIWTCASSAADRAVQAMLATGKVPVNQLTPIEADEGETALDASEQRIHVIQTYFTSMQGKSASDKRDDINLRVLYADYPLAPVIKEGTDPDAFMHQLQARQTTISTALKAKGWSCHKKNCGIETEADAGANVNPPEVGSPDGSDLPPVQD